MNEPTAPRHCVVANESAVYAARALLRPFASAIGFQREVIEELVVVVSELTSNILKYGRRGSITLTETTSPAGRGIEIVAEDETPPFDLVVGRRDGHDADGPLDPARVFGRRGIGAGLGAVFRLTDSVDVVPTAGGKRIVVRRTVGPPRRGSTAQR